MLRRKGVPACANNNRRLRGYHVKKGLDELGDLDAVAEKPVTRTASVPTSRDKEPSGPTNAAHKRSRGGLTNDTNKEAQPALMTRIKQTTHSLSSTRHNTAAPVNRLCVDDHNDPHNDSDDNDDNEDADDRMGALHGTVFGRDWSEWCRVKETLFNPQASVAAKVHCLDMMRVWRARARKHRPLPPYVECTSLLFYPVLLDEGRDEMGAHEPWERPAEHDTAAGHAVFTDSRTGATVRNTMTPNAHPSAHTHKGHNTITYNHDTHTDKVAATITKSVDNNHTNCTPLPSWMRSYTTLVDSDFLAQCYGAALSRAVHVMTGSFVDGDDGDTYRKRARARGFPEEAVEVRQRVAHAAVLPGLSELRWVTSLVLQYLYRQYWMVQEAHLKQTKTQEQRTRSESQPPDTPRRCGGVGHTQSAQRARERTWTETSDAVMSMAAMRKFVSELGSSSDDDNDAKEEKDDGVEQSGDALGDSAGRGSAKGGKKNKKRRKGEQEEGATEDGCEGPSMHYARCRDADATHATEEAKVRDGALLGWTVQ